MKPFLKWLLIIGAGLGLVIVALALIVPQFVDVKKYKPVIEEKVGAVTGRSFSIGDEMDLSVFPWVGVKLTDIRLGNPNGFGQETMVGVKRFEVRLKVMPLLSKQIEVKTFVLDSPVIYLEKDKKGNANWQGIGKSRSAQEKPAEKPASKSQGLPIASLQVDRFSILNGQLKFLDQTSGVEKQISEFNLELTDISLDQPLTISFGALLDGKPLMLDGTIGPIGQTPGQGKMGVDLALNALGELTAKITGNLVNAASQPQFDFNISTDAFSPRNLLASLGQELPVTPSDTTVLNKVRFSSKITGTPKNISIADGKLILDDSILVFSATAKQFSKPDITFSVSLDQIDVDRYLPKPQQGEAAKDANTSSPEQKVSSSQPVDYTPFRKLVLDGEIKAGKIKARGATVEQLNIHVKAKGGVISVDPFGMNLYQGSMASTLGMDVRGKQPKISMALNADGIQAGPLLKDVLKKETLEGGLKADVNLTMSGDSPDRIKQTLNGKGGLVFTDGAIIGIDIPGMVRNAKAKLTGQAQATGERPRTDFAELNVPFTAKNGLIKTDGTRMLSPLIRLVATGDINLVKELLDMRVDPKFVATLKGQGDTQERAGLMVPLLITGSFASPKIRPDLKGMLGVGDKTLDPNAIKQQILGTGDSEKGGGPDVKTQVEDVKEKLKGLLPGLTQ